MDVSTCQVKFVTESNRPGGVKNLRGRYGTVGLGFISTWGDSQKNLGTKFTMNYGGGVKLRKILGPLGLRFDLRGYTAFNALEGSPIFENQRVDFIEGTVNLFISF